MSVASPPTGDPPRQRSRQALAVALVIGGSLALGVAAGRLALGELPVLALLFPIALVPVIVWRRPQVAVYVLFAFGIVIEQFVYSVGPRLGAVTAHVPIFQRALPGGANVAELFLISALVIVTMQAVQRQRSWLHGSPLRIAISAFMGMAVAFLVLGLARGGEPTPALWEIRPYLYLFLAYLLASHLMRSYRDVRPLLWILVVGGIFKATYGLTIFWSVRSVEPRPEAVLAHEESFFFGLYLVATAAMWLFAARGPLRVVATLGVPIVLVCDMVNSRRSAWLILIVGMALLGVIALVRLHERRRVVAAMLAVAIGGACLYLPVFWDKSGTLAQPARAVRSAVAPDGRDDTSNMYREVENYNLKVYIKQSRSLGTGFGHKIQYFGLVDLTGQASMLAYVPHNTVLYVWLRTGALGMVVFGLFLAQAMISAVRLSATRRRDVGMVGAITASALTGYVAMGAVDMGFFWFRIALVMGVLLGTVDGLLRQTRTEVDHPLGSAALHPGRPPRTISLTGAAP